MNVEIVSPTGHLWSGYMNQAPRVGDAIQLPGATYQYQVARVVFDLGRGTVVVMVVS